MSFIEDERRLLNRIDTFLMNLEGDAITETFKKMSELMHGMLHLIERLHEMIPIE